MIASTLIAPELVTTIVLTPDASRMPVAVAALPGVVAVPIGVVATGPPTAFATTLSVPLLSIVPLSSACWVAAIGVVPNTLALMPTALAMAVPGDVAAALTAIVPLLVTSSANDPPLPLPIAS